MDEGVACVKYILITCNLLVWILGLGVLSVGIWIRSDPDFWVYQDNLPLSNYYNACYVVMAVGLLLLVLGFMGCCAAAIDSPCMLLTYFIAMFVLLIMECAVAGLVWKVADGDQLQHHLASSIEQKLDTIIDDPKARRFMDLMQVHLECCGAISKHDYEVRDMTIPQSCSSSRTNNIFIYGCSENLRVLLERTGAVVGGLGLALGFVQIIVMIISLCLFCTIRQDSK
ncbi:CD9 antigen-like [Dermacentor variabilis]|uniref:CD9 antigen-like n=1 Tax=Dermacentor variabilis TaxID=34621 RepID=UPI003F5BFB8F